MLVDFSDALKARIDSMSTDELAATEMRRMTREADRTDVMTLDALWEPASGNPTTKTVTVRIDTGSQGAPDILRLDQGTTFHESIILGIAIYRLIAGGDASLGQSQRFVINPGGAGLDKVSVDRAALAAIVARERPVEMTRSRRLVALEQRPPASHLSETDRIAYFEDKWIAETINLRIDSIVSKVASRAMLLLGGRDHVGLWVRRDDLTVGPDRILGSPLARAIVQPGSTRTPRHVLVPALGAAAGDTYIKNSFGSGLERSLILDVAQIRKIIASMPSEDLREAALVLVERLIDRSAALGRERSMRAKLGVYRNVAAEA